MKHLNLDLLKPGLGDVVQVHFVGREFGEGGQFTDVYEVVAIFFEYSLVSRYLRCFWHNQFLSWHCGSLSLKITLFDEGGRRECHSFGDRLH